MANLPRVALIITGGTIDSVGKDRLDLAWYIEAGKRLGDGELLQQLPELKASRRSRRSPFGVCRATRLFARIGLISFERSIRFSIKTKPTVSSSPTEPTPSRRPPIF